MSQTGQSNQSNQSNQSQTAQQTAQQMAQISNLKRKRSTVKGWCTRLTNYLDSISVFTDDIIINIEARGEKLPLYWSEYNKIQGDLETMSDESDEDRLAFEDVYFSLVARVRRILREFGPQLPIATPPPGSTPTLEDRARGCQVRLPKIDLPRFSGQYGDWIPFHDAFKAIINENTQLTNIQRFQYLKSAMSGDAADVIQSLELTAQNYNVAWELLRKRYDNRRAIVHSHVRELFETTPVAKENARDLRRMTDNIIKHMQALRALQRPTDTWDDLIVYLITQKLDGATAREWQNSQTDTTPPAFQQLIDFLEHRCHMLEALEGGQFSNKNGRSQNSARRQSAHVTSITQHCEYCKGEHQLYRCHEFLNLSIEQRNKVARQHKICANCLRTGKHAPGACKFGSCRMCGQRHNTLLHASATKSPSISGADNAVRSNQISSDVVSAHSSTRLNTEVLLSTALIFVNDANNKRQLCRALLDSGSQANFVTTKCLNRLRLRSESTSIRVTGIQSITNTANRVARMKIGSRVNEFATSIECIVTDMITDRIPGKTFNSRGMRIPSNIKLADPHFFKSAEIDILIGAGLFWQLLCVGQLKATVSHPTIQKTHLGWVLAGECSGDIDGSGGTDLRVLQVSVSNEELHNQLTKFWCVEELNASKSTQTLDEQFCERHFLDNVTRTAQGRIKVKMPVREDIVKRIGNTYDAALKRFYSIEKKLERNIDIRTQYVDFMREYLSLGHMKLIPPEHTKNKNTLSVYLPHHGVLKSNSMTTKLRVVFDGSCKGSGGASLNDALITGPVVQQDLVSILMRFRTFNFVFSTDITKMYRQFLIADDQTSLQRILWRENKNDSLNTYELNTITYGTTSAPYLATRALNYLAELYTDEYPLGAKHIMRDFYVDDLLTGADDINLAVEIRDQIIKILKRGSLQLNKWSANEEQLLTEITNNNESLVTIDKSADSRILGILWNPSTDTFKFNIKLNASDDRVTKRNILSEIARLFDPIGLLGPVIIIPKLIIQEIWKLKLNWDESVPIDLHTQWTRIKEQLEDLKELNIPRCVKNKQKGGSIQLHGFCDASQRVYGACIYIRSVNLNGRIDTRLLCSKGRVAPLKAISLPRLELCAAVLLAQLLEKVQSAIHLNPDKTVLWSDSTIALSWIASHSRKWSVFVANRVGEIQRLTDVSLWRHVPSPDNPADLLSRGVNPKELINTNLWWHGPHFLELSEVHWPTKQYKHAESELPEQGKKMLTVRVSTENIFLTLINKFSNLDKICRIVAYCLRFLKKTINKYSTVCITHQECTLALEILCKIVQRIEFAVDYRMLIKGNGLQKTSALSSLNPFIDRNQLIRVGGRLQNSQLNYETRHPIVLPKESRLTKLIIEAEHKRSLHSGLQGTMAIIRQRFWPLSLRSATRKVVHNCITCFKNKPLTSEAQMGVLPFPRVTPSRPFSHCGIDYAGPVILRERKRRNARNSKAYIGVFVCMSSKAAHLELISNLTSDAFLTSLKRFISRRGKPVSVYSDNGTTFVGAAGCYQKQKENY